MEPTMKALFEARDPDLRLPLATIYVGTNFQVDKPTDPTTLRMQPPTSAALYVPPKYASEFPTTPDHVIQQKFWAELGYKVARLAPDDAHLWPVNRALAGVSPRVAMERLWFHVHHVVDPIMIAKHGLYRTATDFVSVLTPQPLHSRRSEDLYYGYYNRKSADERKRAGAADMKAFHRDHALAIRMKDRTDKHMHDRRHAQAQRAYPNTRPSRAACQITKLDGRASSIGNGWPGEGNVRPFTFEFTQRPGAIVNSVEDFLKGFAPSSSDSDLLRLGMERNNFGKRAHYLLQEASRYACNGAIQHVSFSDANVTVFVQFFQLSIDGPPSQRSSPDACGSSCAVAVVDWRTMSTSEVLATYIGFCEHAYKTIFPDMPDL